MEISLMAKRKPKLDKWGIIIAVLGTIPPIIDAVGRAWEKHKKASSQDNNSGQDSSTEKKKQEDNKAS
jgi:hypothetical protein